MWRFKPFMQKEQTGLEGRRVEIGNLKLHVQNAIAEGGFSCVYLARDAVHSSKQYALKHMICNDGESLDLVKKEISVMKLLRGHPNVVSLQAQTILDMGRTKEALLVMDFCDKSLVGVLENRGAGYFEEKQILLIFRDVCNAVFAMHCQSPPIAHRDLKVENVLLGSNGAWKLCDFGSSSTNHKRFDRPEEMGIEEDNIRKHTTPAYRAPEMWDLFRREIISEKVDIWALGCLLYRICYLKSAFDGESKLQILNGNYRIPESPRYSSSITDLIKDMLQASPDARPDITQVWFRVNEQLPLELQKEMPDGPISLVAADIHLPNASTRDDVLAKRVPRRSPPPPPSSVEQARDTSVKEPQHSRPSQSTSKVGGGGSPLGAFWSTQYANDAEVDEEKGLVFDDKPSGGIASKTSHRSPENRHNVGSVSTPEGHRAKPISLQSKKSVHGNSGQRIDDGSSEDFEIRFFPGDAEHNSDKIKASNTANISMFQNEAFNTFIAEFDSSMLNTGNNNNSEKEELEAEVERLKEQLKQTNLEKVEITSKYEKLSAICRSQRQEIQELKNALAARTPSPNKDGSKIQNHSASWQSGTQHREKIEGSVWELEKGMFTNSSSSPVLDPTPWKAFNEEPKSERGKAEPLLKNNQARSVRTNGQQNKKTVVSSSADTWGFGQDRFTAIPASSQASQASNEVNSFPRFGNQNTIETKSASHPAGWAGF